MNTFLRYSVTVHGLIVFLSLIWPSRKLPVHVIPISITVTTAKLPSASGGSSQNGAVANKDDKVSNSALDRHEESQKTETAKSAAAKASTERSKPAEPVQNKTPRDKTKETPPKPLDKPKLQPTQTVSKSNNQPDIMQTLAKSGSLHRSSFGPSQITRLRNHITRNWTLPATMQHSRDLKIVIVMQMRPDGTVKHAKVLPSERPNHMHKAASESALRAIVKSQPLPLPEDQYPSWRTITLVFYPQMLMAG